MANHGFSAAVALVLALVAIAGGQLFKETLAASRQGTLIAGGLGSLVFIFTLTAISNAKMASVGSQEKSGLNEVLIALVIAVIASGAIHRVSITVCVLFSVALLFFVNEVSQARYGATTAQQQVVVGAGKKRK
ncbi:keratinocyte associated protein 2 [Aphelenchoides avenae]|nr:keratinocyte associated protein 2 [Aphelenchus avenae]